MSINPSRAALPHSLPHFANQAGSCGSGQAGLDTRHRATEVAVPPRTRKRPNLGNRSTLTLMRLLADRGLSAEAIDAGLDYVEAVGARTVREGYELAMSRVLYSDVQLEQGMRFTFE